MRHGSRRSYQRRKQRRMQQRGAPRSSISVGPGGATGSHHDRRRCARGGCSRPGAQAAAHWGLEAVGRHSQAQLWRRGATSRSRPRLCPADLLAGSPVVSTSRRAAQHRARGARWAASRCYVHGIARASREPGVVTDPQRAELGPVARPRRSGDAARLRTRTGGSAGHRKMPQNRSAIGAAAPPRPASRRLKRSDVV
eukprot:COSAG06_NODE_8363_length_2189_cov_48.041070_1_plen_197_part_00